MPLRTAWLRRFASALLVWPLALVACGGSDTTITDGEPEVDGGRADADGDPYASSMDAFHDAPADTSVHDATLDAEIDAANDAPIDSESDSGSDAGIDAASDAGTDATLDAAVDGGVDAALDAPIDVYVPPPVGTQLAPGNDLSVRGVTSDGYVVFSNDAALTLHAVPLAGGAVQNLGALGGKFWVTLVGKTVFAWSSVSDPNVGTLRVWSSSAGLHTVSSASFGIVATASPAGDRILYLDNVDVAGSTADITLSAVDGTAAQKLVTGVKLAGCFPQMGFVGSYVLASYCPVPRDAGPSSTISAFASPTWTKTELVKPAANYWSTDAAGPRCSSRRPPVSRWSRSPAARRPRSTRPDTSEC
jgi:hypothetical protein